MKANNILELVGNTPVVQINKLFLPNLQVWMKLEKQNPGGSIKDRIALSMIEAAEREGIINKDTIIVEPTSGNTGVGLAMVCAVKGYKLVIVMPESMSIERRRIMQAYGAELVLSPREKGMRGAIEMADEWVKTHTNAWMPLQFSNKANPEVHRRITALEIMNDFPEGIDYLVTGVGTGGHITGVAQILKKHMPDLKVFAVEPVDSPVISGGKPSPHALQGIGAGFIPENLDKSILDGVFTISKEEAFTFARAAATQEGILVGISTGASLAAVKQLSTQISGNARILTFNYDTGERYLSVDGFVG